MTAADRAQRTDEADELCRRAFADSGAPEQGAALIAVGGYGRGELAPYSDLDVVLVLEDHVEAGEWSGRIWYPLWDSGRRLDHSVRTFSEVVVAAAADLRVMLGLLDTRHLAGDPNLTLRLRTTVLTQWRRDARGRLEELRRLGDSRGELLGELAHSAVPDLKESMGGLRDATVLKALVASWLVDVPHADLERSRTALLDVRDALHEVAGRGSDRVLPEHWADLAERLGFDDVTTVQRHTRGLGRRITHLSRLTWARASDVLRGPSKVRRPHLEPIAAGVAVAYGEVVLAAGAPISQDPTLLLRCAAEAAERKLALSPATAARLVREAPALPQPWSDQAREMLVRLLLAGSGLRAVWETLEETGAVSTFLPEWERIRLLPHASVVHRFTVDRHVIETCIEVSKLIRRVDRPDLLAIGALLHDIGKGGTTAHAEAGVPIAKAIAERLGFPAADVDTLVAMVRWHLLLPDTATTRDLDDPATVAAVTDKVSDLDTLTLLHTLCEADARATAEKAWSPWRATLIGALFDRVQRHLVGQPRLAEEPLPAVEEFCPGSISVSVEATVLGSRVRVVADDRVGMLADAAAALAWQRASVRAARVWTTGGVAISEWDVAEAERLDAGVLKQRLEALAAGHLDPTARLSLATQKGDLAPLIRHHLDASDVATVVEVRTEDRPGLIYAVCRAVATMGVSVRSAHVSTVGPQAVDVFYLVDSDGTRLPQPLVSAVVGQIEAALSTPDR